MHREGLNRLEHSGDIFVSDCDIQKFFDTINHDIVMESFFRLTDGIENNRVRSEFAAVLAAYMRPYSFSSCVIDKSREDGFWNIKSHDVYRLGPGGGDSSLWTGFLGYEMNFIGATRLRSSNYQKLLDRINSCASRVRRAIGKLLTVEDEKRDAQAEIVMKSIRALYDCPMRISRYKELDMARFVHTRQYRFIVEIVNRRLLRIKEKCVDKHRDNLPECIVTCMDSYIADLTAEKIKNG